MVVRPMLACGLDNLEDMTFPKLVSYKLDGCLALIVNGVVQTRSGKPFPSETVQKLFGKQELNGLVGEIIVGPPNVPTTFNTTTGAVRSKKLPEGISEEMFHFYVYDYWNSSSDYSYRATVVSEISHEFDLRGKNIKVLEQIWCKSYEELLQLESVALTNGYEGLIARDPSGLYKHGRCTPKSQTLVKVKRFEDDEALIIGVEELMHNANIQTKGVFGNSERSSHKENLVPMDTLGALVCQTKDGVVFNIGTGYTQKMRDGVWQMYKEGKLLGEYVKYKSFKIGVVNAPRLPVYKEIIGIRMKEDM